MNERFAQRSWNFYWNEISLGSFYKKNFKAPSFTGRQIWGHKEGQNRHFFPSKGYLRKTNNTTISAEIFLVIESTNMNIHTKFQLNPLSCSRDIVATMHRYFSIMNFRAFRKNSIKNQRFNIFWCGLRQTSSNTCLYHICENERNRRYRLSTAYWSRSWLSCNGSYVV
jgi:hypothetical protein